MLSTTTLATILQAPFLIEGQALQMLYAEVAQLLNGQSGGINGPVREVKQLSCLALTPHAAALGVQSYSSFDEAPAGSIAVHTVAGVMMPDDSWYAVGTRTIGQRMQQADAHPNIVAHVGMFNTPGGSTMGLENFAATIAGTQKPFVSLVQQACSAGYWSASAGNVVMLAGRTAMCGSIGTMAQFLDFSGYFEKMGVKQVVVNATKSTDKNAAFQSAVDGDPKPLQEQLLDPLNEVFLSTVLANRADTLDPKTAAKTVLTGKVFVGQANIDNGLADVLGTLDDALALAQQLADSSASSSSTSNSMFGKKLTLGAATHALVTTEALTAEQVTAANSELTAAGVTGAQFITEAAFNDLTAKAGRADAAEASVKAFTEALAAASVADVAALVASRDEWKTKAETYGSQAGAMGTSAKKEGSDIDEGTPATAAQKAIDGLAHNTALDDHPMFGGKK